VIKKSDEEMEQTIKAALKSYNSDRCSGRHLSPSPIRDVRMANGFLIWEETVVGRRSPHHKTLELVITEDKSRIVVTKNEGIIGLITRNGIALYVQIMGK
jgi:hypothetical protein